MAREDRAVRARAFWQAVVAEQASSGKSVRGFCRERGVGEHSFYVWRKRLAGRNGPEPVRFALVERRGEGTSALASVGQAIELVLIGGERLRIPVSAGELTTTLLQTVLRELRTPADRRP